MEEILIAQQFDVGEEKDNGHIWYRSYIVKELFLIINPSWTLNDILGYNI